MAPLLLQESIYTWIRKIQTLTCGIDRAAALVEETLRRQGLVNLYAVVVDTPGESEFIPKESIPFHKDHGFTEEGRMAQVGVKFGKWFDTVILVKRLMDRNDNPAKPQPYFTIMND